MVLQIVKVNPTATKLATPVQKDAIAIIRVPKLDTSTANVSTLNFVGRDDDILLHISFRPNRGPRTQ